MQCSERPTDKRRAPQQDSGWRLTIKQRNEVDHRRGRSRRRPARGLLQGLQSDRRGKNNMAFFRFL